MLEGQSDKIVKRRIRKILHNSRLDEAKEAVCRMNDDQLVRTVMVEGVWRPARRWSEDTTDWCRCCQTGTGQDEMKKATGTSSNCTVLWSLQALCSVEVLTRCLSSVSRRWLQLWEIRWNSMTPNSAHCRSISHALSQASIVFCRDRSFGRKNYVNSTWQNVKFCSSLLVLQ